MPDQFFQNETLIFTCPTLLVGFPKTPLTRRDFTTVRLAGRGNFSGLLLNVAGVDIGYFNEKRLRRLIEQ